MDIILEVGLEHKILKLHCVNESCDTDYTLFATDKDGLEYSLVYSYDEDWYKYIKENPNDTYTGEAWIWLIKNSSPDYIGYRDENNMWIEEHYVYMIEVKNTDILW